MRIGSIKENQNFEKRIAITPEIIKKYSSLGFEICLSENYGSHLGITDDEYSDLGVKFSKDDKEIINSGDIITQVGLFSGDKQDLLKENQILVGSLNPFLNKTKIDNLVQIGHNVKVGNDCLIVAQVGIAGSVKIEDQVMVGGQAGFAGHITIGKGAKIAGQAGITKDVEAGAFLKGNPALPVHLAQRIAILQRKLPDLFNRFAQLEANK